jgi:hypothetical protein
MRARLIRLAVVWAAATCALAIALDVGPHQQALAVEAYLDFLCALVLAGLAATIASALPSANVLRREPRPPAEPPPERPAQLEMLERALKSSEHSGLESQSRLISTVRQIAASILARRHGVALERDHARARELLGVRVWNVLRDERPGDERAASGTSLAELEPVIADLEAI